MTTIEQQIAAASPGPLHPVIKSWLRAMRSANLSDATVRVYDVSALRLDAFLRSDAPEPADCLCPPCAGRHELSQVDNVTDVARAHAQAFIGHLAATKAASTASNRYRVTPAVL